ncbi:unnamed protein product [Didymodactylos carnosus]|uniref:Enkurin domain-containing protein n=2 Tax=Didymodactylos carnosus TaxID=1234261 RepID=A0A814RL18_9BILA|nr:unnamed protein product [Didymodactylos carnosus]CAF3899063.1 unnamed protein product [Didymodactylos carnosus]
MNRCGLYRKEKRRFNPSEYLIIQIDLSIMADVQETVYNLLQRVPAQPTGEPCHRPRYRSKFAPCAWRTIFEGKSPHRTRSKTKKDFIKENICKAVQSKPSCPKRYVVSDRKGNKYLIDGSGLQKEFICKKTYGEVPCYITARKKCLHQMREQYQNEMHERTNRHVMKILPMEERQSLINNLKNRYEEIFHDFLRLPVQLDTMSAINKKERLTRELVEIERDIDFLEKHQRIIVVDNYDELDNGPSMN